MGCIARLGCLILLACLAVGAWLTRDQWLHKITGKPVVTSNQAMVWHCLKELGVRAAPSGYGRLFDTLGTA